MQSDYKPIIFDIDPDMEDVELHIVHDIHYGNAQHHAKQWNAFKDRVVRQRNAYVVFIGDMMENVIPSSKGDIFGQTASPQEQKEWLTDQLLDLKDKTICVLDGNHERNRSTKAAGLYPLYDCCVIAGIKERYRPHFAFVDIGVGRSAKNPNRQIRYIGYLVHKAKDMKNFSTADTVDGIDFMAYGHDHDPKDHTRAKLVYNSNSRTVSLKNVETINSGAFLVYGEYSVDNGYRPLSEKKYKLILHGGAKRIESVGYYL